MKSKPALFSRKDWEEQAGRMKDVYFLSSSVLVTLFLFQMVSLSNTIQNVDFIPGLLLHLVQSKNVGIIYHFSKSGQTGITNSCKLGPIERPLKIARKQNFGSVYLPCLALAKNTFQVSCLQRWLLLFFLSLECISHIEEK